MSCLLLALIATVLASPYQEARAQAELEDRLIPGDTAVLVGLAGDHGCTAAHDPEDCAALRREPPSGAPLVELVPVPALLLPSLGDQPASLLLPRFPYGLDEPVTPLLGPLLIGDPRASWIRVPLPPDADVASGHGVATLLLRPDATGPVLELIAAPPGPPRLEALDAHTRAAAWPQGPLPYSGTQVLLPLLLEALRFDGPAGAVELAWSDDAPPPIHGQPLAAEDWREAAQDSLTLATGLCMRAYYTDALRRPARGSTVAPSQLTAPRMAVLTDDEGRVAFAAPLDAPWDRAEPAACLQANARLLPPLDEGARLAVLELSLPEPAAPPPAALPSSSR